VYEFHETLKICDRAIFNTFYEMANIEAFVAYWLNE